MTNDGGGQQGGEWLAVANAKLEVSLIILRMRDRYERWSWICGFDENSE